MKKDIVEDHEKISVFTLKKEGYFEGMTEGNYLEMIEGQNIPLMTTPCHFGGFRFWFLCPDCGKRVAVLYRIRYYLCRDCHRLSYILRQVSGSKFEQLLKDAKVRQRLLKILDGIGQKGLSKLERSQIQNFARSLRKRASIYLKEYTYLKEYEKNNNENPYRLWK